MHRTPRRVLPATVILLGGLNAALGAAVAIDDSGTHAYIARVPQTVLYNGACPNCVNEQPGQTIQLDSDKAEYACCDRAGFCAVCSDCPWWNPYC